MTCSHTCVHATPGLSAGQAGGPRSRGKRTSRAASASAVLAGLEPAIGLATYHALLWAVTPGRARSPYGGCRPTARHGLTHAPTRRTSRSRRSLRASVRVAGDVGLEPAHSMGLLRSVETSTPRPLNNEAGSPLDRLELRAKSGGGASLSRRGRHRNDRARPVDDRRARGVGGGAGIGCRRCPRCR